MILGLLTNRFSERDLKKKRNEIYNTQYELENEIEKLKQHEYKFEKKIEQKVARTEFYYKVYTDTANNIIKNVYDFFSIFNNNLLPEFYQLLRFSLLIKGLEDKRSLAKKNIDLIKIDIQSVRKILDLYGYLDNTKYIYIHLKKNHFYADWLNDNQEYKDTQKSISVMIKFLNYKLSNLDDSIISISEKKAIQVLKFRLRSSNKYKSIIAELRSTRKYYETNKKSLFNEIKSIDKELEHQSKTFDELAINFKKQWKDLFNQHRNLYRGFKRAEELNLKIGYIYKQKGLVIQKVENKIKSNSQKMKNNKINKNKILSEQQSEKARLYNLSPDEDEEANNIKNNLSNLSNRFQNIQNHNNKLYNENSELWNEKQIISDAFNDLANSYNDSVASIFNFPKEIENNLPKYLYSDRMKSLFFSNEKDTNTNTSKKIESVKSNKQREFIDVKENNKSESINSLFNNLFKLFGEE